MSDLFAQIILDEAKHPANYGVIDGEHLKQIKYNPSCGDVIQLTVKVDEEKKLIKELKWTGEGCSISMASMSLLSQQVIGQSFEQVLKLNEEDMLKLLDLPDITPGRTKCMMIGLSALQDLLSNSS